VSLPLVILGALVGGFAYGFGAAAARDWWRGRRPFEIGVRVLSDETAVITAASAISRAELHVLEAVVERTPGLILDASVRVKSWRFGEGALPGGGQ
jgi:hypothetical protein